MDKILQTSVFKKWIYIPKLKDLLISKTVLWSNYFVRTWVWSGSDLSSLQSEHKRMQAQLSLTINSSSATGSDHSLFERPWIWSCLINVRAMV